MILQTLYQNCIKQGVEFYNEFYVLDLVMSEDGQRTAGVVAYELATGEIHVFRAKSVVFATGGFGKVYKTTSNAHSPATASGSSTVTGFPGGHGVLPVPPDRPGPGSGCCSPRAPAARAASHATRTASGSWSATHPPSGPGAARHGRPGDGSGGARGGRGAGPDSTTSTSTSHTFRPNRSRRKLPDITEFARTYLGVDPITELVPVFPTAHYAMGGIPTNVETEVLRDNDTVVPGPYAAGEYACVSVHGPTGWAPTRCWTSMSSAGGRGSPPPRRRLGELPDLPTTRRSWRPWSPTCASRPG